MARLQSTFTKRVWLVVVLIGFAIVTAVGVLSYSSQFDQVRTRSQNTLDYIKTQSFIYEFYNDSSTTKSLLRSLENAQQLSRYFEIYDGDVSQKRLENYISGLRLTGVYVLSPKGKLLASYSSDDIGYSDLSDALLSQSLLDVANYPKKAYTTRLKLPDGSYVDIGAAGRTDTKGVVVTTYHTSSEFAERYKLTLQSLLNGYDIVDDGAIVIESDNKVVASNTVDDVSTDTVLLAQLDSNVVTALKSNLALGESNLVNVDGSYYFGMYSKVRDYYVYSYTKASAFTQSVLSNALIAFALYVVVICTILIVRRKSDHTHLAELVDQEHRYSAQLEASALEAQRANRAKTEFLQRMSHDIRTPINGIRGMVEVGSAYADDLDKQKECREKIWTASGLLLDLVNEVLDMSKLENNEVVLDIQPMNIRKLSDDVCEMLERQAQERNITIVRELDNLPHPCIMASNLHLKRLVMNMASNAVKYNKQDGTVRVSCKELSCTDEGRATYEIVVADTGIGMSEEFQKHLYEPFAREMQDTSYRPSGTGLGMVITKQLVDVMGGTIEVDSTLGEGTTYTVTLSFDIVPKERLEECDAFAPKGSNSASLAGLNILLVEDNDLNREIAEFVIERAKGRCVSAIDGKQGVEMFEQSKPGEFDVILMDIMMPVMDGYEATRAIRQLDRAAAKTVPIIAMSANAFSDDKICSRQAGMNDHLAKPLDSVELVRAINSALRRGGGRLRSPLNE